MTVVVSSCRTVGDMKCTFFKFMKTIVKVIHGDSIFVELRVSKNGVLIWGY